MEIPLLEKQYQQQIEDDKAFHEQQEEERVRTHFVQVFKIVCVGYLCIGDYRDKGSEGERGEPRKVDAHGVK